MNVSLRGILLFVAGLVFALVAFAVPLGDIGGLREVAVGLVFLTASFFA